jgi:hypothetical protein
MYGAYKLLAELLMKVKGWCLGGLIFKFRIGLVERF